MAHDGQDRPMTDDTVLLPDLLDLTAAAVSAAESVLETAKAAVRETVSAEGKVSARLIEANQAAAHGLSWLVSCPAWAGW